MKKIVFAFVIILFLTHCAGNDQANETPSKGASTKTKDTKKGKAASTTEKAPAGGFKLEFIKSIPGSVDGCGIFFTYDTCKLKDEKYIFLSDMGDMAMIRIKGKDIVLKKNKRESKQINAISSVEVFYAVGYKVVLRKKEEKVVDEFYEYSGTLKITGKKIKTTIKVHGEGGC
jgi:uncharacterized protein YlzI (FlbEa/FlbD family)